MAELYLDKNELKISIKDWEDTITSDNGTWGGNNLHIDEIRGLDKIIRSEWIEVSLQILDILSTEIELIDSLILFLHIDIKYSLEKIPLDRLSLSWLQENVSEWTPPSLNYTSLEYYTNFYLKELTAIKLDNSIIEFINSFAKMNFFYRIYFDKEEGLYSHEIYIFIVNDTII